MPFWKTRNASSLQIIDASVTFTKPTTSAGYCSSLLLNEDAENGESTGYSAWLETRGIIGPTSFQLGNSSTVIIISIRLNNFIDSVLFLNSQCIV
jgi:hypothetical protein